MQIDEMCKKLTDLMEKGNISRTELSRIAGVSPAFITSLLSGYKIPSIQVLKRIADYFNVTVDYLIN